MAGKVTLESLREEMLAGFARVDARFEQVDKRFEQVDLRLDKAEQDVHQLQGATIELQDRMDRAEQRMDEGFARMDEGFAMMLARFSDLETMTRSMLSVLTQLVPDLAEARSHERRITALEVAVFQKLKP